MRQGMDPGRPSPDRRGTSRTGRPSETKRHQAAGKPATGRMGVQGGGSRGEAAARQGAPAAPGQESNKNTLYLALGGGALALVLIVALVAGGGGDSSGGGGPSADSIVTRAMNQAQAAYQAGEYRAALDLCEDALKNPKSHRSSRINALQALANTIRVQVNLDHDGQVKVAEFQKRIDASKADQTAMAKAKGFWDECLVLQGQYGATTAAKQLKDIKEDLRRWVATESQGDWQRDYNVTKARIEKSFLGDQRFSEAIREWKQFGEISQDPLLRSRIEQEVRTINQMSQAAAEKVVTDAGSGADARTKLQEAQERFNGTDGLGVINKAIKSLK